MVVSLLHTIVKIFIKWIFQFKVSCKSGISKVYVLVKIWFSSNKTLMVLTERQKPQQRNGKQTITNIINLSKYNLTKYFQFIQQSVFL